MCILGWHCGGDLLDGVILLWLKEMLGIWKSSLVGTNSKAACVTCHEEKVTSLGAVGHEYTSSMWKLSRSKSDFGGIRTHARKTAALTQRLRPLGHEVTYSESGTRTLVCCVRGSYDNHLHQFGWLENSGIEPETSCMLSTRSANWANPPSCNNWGIPATESFPESFHWLICWVITLTQSPTYHIPPTEPLTHFLSHPTDSFAGSLHWLICWVITLTQSVSYHIWAVLLVLFGCCWYKIRPVHIKLPVAIIVLALCSWDYWGRRGYDYRPH